LETIFSYVLIGGGVVYFTVCLLAFAGHFSFRPDFSDYVPSVSVVIAARNEEKNIGHLLNDLIEQNYQQSKLQIVVVDDASEDDTAAAVKRFATRDDRVRLAMTQFSESPYSHKKRAIHEGIMLSEGEIIFTIDADCRVRRDWIKGMVKHFSPDIDLVAGEVLVEGGGLLGWFEALEFTGIQMMAAGLMNAGFPITCNGGNMAYRRSAFDRVGGFGDTGVMVSGDDDLLMQKIAFNRSSSVFFATGSETAVRVKAKNSWREFLSQRARWASKIAAYPSRRAVMLLTVFFAFFASVSLWLLAAISGVLGFGPLLAGFGLKTAGDILLAGYGIIRNGRPGLLFLLPLAEVLHVPYILGVTLKGFFGTFEWRGRRTGAINVESGKNPL